MATSNKILIALFLLPLLILGTNFGALYMKYKNENYTTQNELNNSRLTKNELPPFTRIDLSEFKGDNIDIRSGEAALHYDKSYNDNIRFEVKDNTLFVKTLQEGYHTATILSNGFHYLSTAANVNIDSMYLPVLELIVSEKSGAVSFNAQCDTLSTKLLESSSLTLSPTSVIGVFNLEMTNHTTIIANPNANIKQFGQALISDSANLQLDGKTLKLLLPNQ